MASRRRRAGDGARGSPSRAARADVAAPAPRPTRAIALTRRVLAVYLALVAVGYTFYSPAHWYFNRYLVGADPADDRLPAGGGRALLRAATSAGPRPGRRARDRRVPLAQGRFFASCAGRTRPPGGFLASWRAIGAAVGPRCAPGRLSGRHLRLLRRPRRRQPGRQGEPGRLGRPARRAPARVHPRPGLRYILESRLVFDALRARHAPPGASPIRRSPSARAPAASAVRGRRCRRMRHDRRANTTGGPNGALARPRSTALRAARWRSSSVAWCAWRGPGRCSPPPPTSPSTSRPASNGRAARTSCSTSPGAP